MKLQKKKRKTFKPYLILVILLVLATGIAFYLTKYLYQEQSAPTNDIEQEKLVEKNTTANNEFNLEIAQIGVSAPVIVGIDPANKNEYNQALKNGVAHMVGTSLPGKNSGNIFIYGHSSAAEPSKFDKVFAKLNDLQEKDEILINHEGKSYTYSVSIKKIVEKDDFSVLDRTENETLTLMTCWPVGTNDKRLIITANRI